jgi:molecular chaperone DnaJ
METAVAEKRDYYEVLGVDRNAGPADIKRAFRRLAMQYHPDRNKGDDAEGRFKEIGEAYEVLSDPEKRNRYDRYGHAGLNGVGVHDFHDMRVDDIFSMFSDIFGDAFGGRRARARARANRGVDIEALVEVDLEEVARGQEKTLRFERMDYCQRCGGKGAEPGTDVVTCRTCGGYGQVEQQSNMGFFVTRTVVDCPRCRGRGTMVDTPCKKCRGSGQGKRECAISVKIPAGIHDGQRIRIRGEGEPGSTGTSRGDLHCIIHVRPHPLLQRDGDHLICRVPISFAQAALGADLEVPMLEGKTTLRVPAGTQYGAMFRLPGKGLPNLRSDRRGDEIVQVMIEIPNKLTREQEDALRRFAELEDKNVLPESKGFFERMKEYFTGRGDDNEED